MTWGCFLKKGVFCGMQQDLVSIVIPFKDTARYLPECLDSILAQTYPHWEVLAVDDGSTDNSAQVLDSYAKGDSRIRWFPNRGQGVIQALQTGYAQNRGPLVSRMDSDDFMGPRRLGTMVDSLKEHGPGHLAVGQVRYFAQQGVGPGYRRYEKWLNRLTASGENFSEIYKECVIPSPCWMAHRSDFEACGGFANNVYPEDYDLCFRFYKGGLKVIPCQEVLHHWRDHGARATRTHIHYAENSFLDLKLHYFTQLDHKRERPLVVWGAGSKGKAIAQYFLERQLAFFWVCDNQKKIGQKIYGKELLHYGALETVENPQIIVAVANGSAQKQIRAHLKKLAPAPLSDHFFFC